MSSSKPKLKINNLSKIFPESNLQVIDNISLTVNRGEFVSIIGPSGCGKSTVLDCIAGLTSFDGDISIAGGAAYMFQDDVMFPWRSVLDNIVLPLEVAGMQKEKAHAEARQLLEVFGLEKFTSFYPHQLSGGMRERASLLRTYLSKKELMLLDEPFSKLDALTRQKMQQWFLQVLEKQKKTVLFVTHDIDEAIFLSDRILVCSQRPGKILSEIPVQLNKPRTLTVTTQKNFISIKKKVLQILLQQK